MNELSLFTGIGGGLLGTKLLGWRCIGAVEIDEYCCKVLEQRIKDGCFEPFDIFRMDIREFNRRVAPIYRGKVDVISAGFPCTPFSLAGKRRGPEDERNMWPATIECIRLVRPRHILLENVPGLITGGYWLRVLGDLSIAGYHAPWGIIPASAIGCVAKSERAWLVASSDCEYGETWLGSFQNRTKSLLEGNYRKMLREMWIQTVDRNAGSDNGTTNYLERGIAVGNAQMPLCVVTAWKIFSGEDVWREQ